MAADKPIIKSGPQMLLENMIKSVLGPEVFANMVQTFEAIGGGVTNILASLKRIELQNENLSDRVGRIEAFLRVPTAEETAETPQTPEIKQ